MSIRYLPIYLFALFSLVLLFFGFWYRDNKYLLLDWLIIGTWHFYFKCYNIIYGSIIDFCTVTLNSIVLLCLLLKSNNFICGLFSTIILILNVFHYSLKEIIKIIFIVFKTKFEFLFLNINWMIIFIFM
jgi:hypothetical protein